MSFGMIKIEEALSVIRIQHQQLLDKHALLLSEISDRELSFEAAHDASNSKLDLTCDRMPGSLRVSDALPGSDALPHAPRTGPGAFRTIAGRMMLDKLFQVDSLGTVAETSRHSRGTAATLYSAMGNEGSSSDVCDISQMKKLVDLDDNHSDDETGPAIQFSAKVSEEEYIDHITSSRSSNWNKSLSASQIGKTLGSLTPQLQALYADGSKQHGIVENLASCLAALAASDRHVRACRRLVESARFDLACAVFILANVVVLALVTEYSARNKIVQSRQLPVFFSVTE